MYVFLLISVAVHSFLGFEYLTPLALLSPLFFFDLKEVGFKNYGRGFKWGLPFLIPVFVLFPSEQDLSFIPNYIGIAIAEEIFFRGFLMRKYGNITVSLMFFIPHVILFPTLGAVLTFFPSLVFGYVYKRSSSVIAPIFAHFSANVSYTGLVERFDLAAIPWEIELIP